MAKNVAPNRCSNFDQISTPILTILELQNDTQNHSKIGLRAQGPPRARPGPAQRPPESLSGGMLASFWLQFGPSGGSCSSFFGVHVCFFWLTARLLLVLFFLLRPLLRCSPSELPGYEAQVTKAVASWPRSLMPSFFWGPAAGGRSPLDKQIKQTKSYTHRCPSDFKSPDRDVLSLS